MVSNKHQDNDTPFGQIHRKMQEEKWKFIFFLLKLFCIENSMLVSQYLKDLNVLIVDVHPLT